MAFTPTGSIMQAHSGTNDRPHGHGSIPHHIDGQIWNYITFQETFPRFLKVPQVEMFCSSRNLLKSTFRKPATVFRNISTSQLCVVLKGMWLPCFLLVKLLYYFSTAQEFLSCEAALNLMDVLQPMPRVIQSNLFNHLPTHLKEMLLF